MDLGAIYDKYVNGNSSADILPWINVNNGVKQLTTGQDEDVFPSITNSNRPGQIQINGNYDIGANGAGLNMFNGASSPTTGRNQSATGNNTGQPNVISGATGAPTSDPTTAAYYDDMVRSLQGQAGRLDSQQQIGLQNILNSYNQGNNRLNEQRAVAQRDYNTNKDQNVNSYLDARNGVMQNTRATANALQRLLGLNGAGYSSAALESAPYAAALQGTQNLTSAQRTYGNNAASLDTAWDDTDRTYRNSLDDLNNQKYQQENGLRSSIAQTRADLLDKISQGQIQANMARGQNYATAAAGRGDYQNQINALLDQITGYGQQYANPVLNAGNVSYQAPTQAQFSLDKFAAPTTTQPGGAQSDLSPTFLGLLTGQQGKRDQYGNLIGY